MDCCFIILATIQFMKQFITSKKTKFALSLSILTGRTAKRLPYDVMYIHFKNNTPREGYYCPI